PSPHRAGLGPPSRPRNGFRCSPTQRNGGPRPALYKTRHAMHATPTPKPIALAFSGGLDPSFCIPWLRERGWEVHTVFADTGGVDAEERAYIERRAVELGAASHRTVDGGPALWERFVVPFVQAGEG